MSYLLDIFNKRQPAPQMSAPQQMQRPMAMPSGGPNTGAPVNSSNWGSRNPAGTPDWFLSDATPIPFLNGGGVQGESALQPAQFQHQYQAAGIQPPSMMDQIRAQNSLPPEFAAAFSGGAAPTPPINRGPGGNAQNNPMPTMGGGMAPSMPNAVDQGLGMQQMNFGNPMGGMNNWFSNFTAPRPMPAPAAPAPMMPMKGMFGVR